MKKTWIAPKLEALDVEKTLGGFLPYNSENIVLINQQTGEVLGRGDS